MKYGLSLSSVLLSDDPSQQKKSVFLQVMERTLKTMGLHPTYLEAFKATHDQVLNGDGPISTTDRHHIALMVSLKA